MLTRVCQHKIAGGGAEMARAVCELWTDNTVVGEVPTVETTSEKGI